MADQHNDNIPAVGNLIANDIPDIKENLEWHKDLLQMLVGWKASSIATVGPVPRRSAFAYSDADTLNIGGGSYFHDGTTRQVVFWDTTLTFDLGSGGDNADSDDLGADEWHYIYIDDSAVVTNDDSELDATCFLNDTTAPQYTQAKHGWYNGSDRCIFAVLTNDSNEIKEFIYEDRLVLFADQVSDRAVADLDDTFTTCQLTIPGFATRAMVTFLFRYVDGNSDFYWRTNGQTGSTGHLVGQNTSTEVNMVQTQTVITDATQYIQIKNSASNGNTVGVLTDGWYLPVGM